MPILVHVIMD